MCKETIRRKYYANKIKKKVIKRIFIEPRPINSDEEEGEIKEQRNSSDKD